MKRNGIVTSGFDVEKNRKISDDWELYREESDEQIWRGEEVIRGK